MSDQSIRADAMLFINEAEALPGSQGGTGDIQTSTPVTNESTYAELPYRNFYPFETVLTTPDPATAPEDYGPTTYVADKQAEGFGEGLGSVRYPATVPYSTPTTGQSPFAGRGGAGQGGPGANLGGLFSGFGNLLSRFLASSTTGATASGGKGNPLGGRGGSKAPTQGKGPAWGMWVVIGAVGVVGFMALKGK